MDNEDSFSLEALVERDNTLGKACERLEEHCKKTWICFTRVRDGKATVEVHNLHEIDNETFFQWMLEMWPPSKEYGLKAENYSDLDMRLEAWSAIIGFHSICRMTTRFQ